MKRIPGEHVKKEKETESKMDEDEKGLGDRAVQARCSMNGLNGGNSVSTTGQSVLFVSYVSFINLKSISIQCGISMFNFSRREQERYLFQYGSWVLPFVSNCSK